MKKTIFLCVGLAVVSLLLVQTANAGLINYERRQRRNPPPPGSVTSAPAAQASKSALPNWAINAPRVKNRIEKRYDASRDGKLQVLEAKRFLAYVAQQVQQKGKFKATGLVAQYDINRDGFITRGELASLRGDLRR